MRDWAGARVGLAFIPPGQPRRNGYIESFNGRLRDVCLNINRFWSSTQARLVISDWKTDYIHHRKHSALGYQTQPDTLRPAITDNRLSQSPDRRTGSRHYGHRGPAESRPDIGDRNLPLRTRPRTVSPAGGCRCGRPGFRRRDDPVLDLYDRSLIRWSVV